MQVTLSTEMPDLPAHKCLAMGIFSDEKPPRGVCGFIDWRLNGFISREIKEGRISGEFMEKIVIPVWPGRIKTEMIFLFGLGPLIELTYDRIYTSAYNMVSAIDGMLMRSFAFDLPGDNRSRLEPSVVMEAMITGFFDYLAQDVEKLANMSSCLVTTSPRLKEVTEGVRLFKSHVKDMGAVDFGDLEYSFA